jgi:hypothetical protein
MAIMDLSGGCLCGAVRYRARGEIKGVNNCYCGMCRKSSGAGFMTFVGFGKGDVALSGEPPVAYRSSEIAARGFCGRCGSPITFVYDADPDEIWLSAGSLDDADAVRPKANWHLPDKVGWVPADESLHRVDSVEDYLAKARERSRS